MNEIIAALLQAQQKPNIVEVDEMTQGPQAQNDQMAEIAAMGQRGGNGMSMGMRNMMDALQLDRDLKKIGD